MTPELKQKITDKLRGYLNREPSNDEVINGQNDANLMHWIVQDDIATQNSAIEAVTNIANATSLDVQTLKASPIQVI